MNFSYIAVSALELSGQIINKKSRLHARKKYIIQRQFQTISKQCYVYYGNKVSKAATHL